MRRRTTVSLGVRALGAVLVGFPVLVVLGGILSLFGGLLLGGLTGYAIQLGVDLGTEMLQFSFAAGAVLFSAIWILTVRSLVHDNRRQLLQDTDSIEPTEANRVGAPTQRIAAQFELAIPELRRRVTPIPLAYTVPYADGPVLVVSTGLLEILSDDELEAVLAHELAHVANGDLRLLTWALVPLVTAEEFFETMNDEDGTDPRILPWLVIGHVTVFAATLGAGLFSRGREFAADRAAAAVTGNPSALAAALERLDETTATPPPTDLRSRSRSVDALAIYPTLDPERDGSGGLLSTHPATDRRLERLRRLEASR